MPYMRRGGAGESRLLLLCAAARGRTGRLRQGRQASPVTKILGQNGKGRALRGLCRLDRHRGCSHESRDNGLWSWNVIEDGLEKHAAGGDFKKESRERDCASGISFRGV